MKKFFGEFKKFITRGNVVDLAVGVIIGSAFTAIVTALTNNVFKPLINFIIFKILGSENLSDVYTILVPAFDSNGILDLTQSIYIDWGAFINAILNFFIIAFVLFIIVKFFNKFNERVNDLKSEVQSFSKLDYINLKKQGYSRKQIKKIKQEKELQAKKLAEEEQKRKEEEAKKNAPPTTEQLLTEILNAIKDKKCD